MTKMQSLSYLLLKQSLNCEVQFMNSSLDTHYEGVTWSLFQLECHYNVYLVKTFAPLALKHMSFFVRFNSINSIPQFFKLYIETSLLDHQNSPTRKHFNNSIGLAPSLNYLHYRHGN
jgi:hypothetical protein